MDPRAAHVACPAQRWAGPLQLLSQLPAQFLAQFRRTVRRLCQALACITLAAALHGCSTSTSIEAPAPVVLPADARPAEPDPLPLSVIDAPISFSLQQAIVALESAVPRSFGDLDKRIINPSNKRQKFAFEARRSPFSVRIDGQHLTITSVIEYAGRGWYDPPLAPEVSASCGTDGTRPRIRVAITSDLSLNKNWHLRTRTRLAGTKPYSTETRDECRVTLFAIDVTSRVVNAVDTQLRSQLRNIDRKLATLDVQRPLEHWYNLLNKPVHVADSLWLTFNPGEVQFGGLRADDSTITADIRLFAAPVITAGPRPEEILTPLPPLKAADVEVGDSLRVLVDGQLGYDVASLYLRKILIGRKFSRFRKTVRIDSADMYGLGDGRVVVSLLFAGALNGHAFLVGTPSFDSATQMLVVPDLSFDVATDNALAQGVAWFKREDVINELRKRAQIPLTSMIDDVRDRVEDAMNRDLTEGVSLGAELTSGRLVEVHARETELRVRSEITGTLMLAIDRKLPVRKAPRRR